MSNHSTPVGDAAPDSPDRHDLAEDDLAMSRPPLDGPDRDLADAAIRRAKELCQPSHDRADPRLPCAACIRRADAEMQPPAPEPGAP